MRNRRLSLSAIAVIALCGALSFAWPASARTQDFEVTGWKAAMIIAVIFLILAAGLAGLIFFVKRRKAASTAPLSAHQPGLNPAPVFSPVWQLAMGAKATQPGIRKTAKFASPVKTETITASLNAAAKLIFSLGPLQGQEFVVGNGLFIGRDSSRSDVVVLNPMVSGQHLWIGPVNGHFVARDCNSTNGTYLNNQMNQRITEIELRDGDVLTLCATGTVKLVFRC
ncbi:MAG: FHA domain-containing protein [Acidobacteria bacterium]|nr:FHA domain-containing protein [Acidobacteriota bacterium]